MRLRARLRLRRWRAARRARLRQIRFRACAHRTAYWITGPMGPDNISVDYKCCRCGANYYAWIIPNAPESRWFL